MVTVCPRKSIVKEIVLEPEVSFASRIWNGLGFGGSSKSSDATLGSGIKTIPKMPSSRYQHLVNLSLQYTVTASCAYGTYQQIVYWSNLTLQKTLMKIMEVAVVMEAIVRFREQ